METFKIRYKYEVEKKVKKTLPTIELLFLALIQCCSGQQTIITKKSISKYKKLCEIEIISSTNVGYIDLILQ